MTRTLITLTLAFTFLAGCNEDTAPENIAPTGTAGAATTTPDALSHFEPGPRPDKSKFKNPKF